jgi:hypothetical protein
MNRLIRVVLILAGTLAVAFVLALVFARLYFTDEKILATVRPQLEQNLNREIDIQSAKISFWGGLGVRLEQVTLGNAPGFTRPVFLHLDELDVKVRFWPLLSGDVVLDRVLIGPGELRLERDAHGNNWTNIVKPDTTTVPVTPVDSAIAALPRIPVAGDMEFIGITVSLDDYAAETSFELAQTNGRLELTAQEEELTARAHGRITVDSGKFHTGTFDLDLTKARPGLDFDLRMGLMDKSFAWEQATLTAFGIPVTLSGTLKNPGDSAVYAIEIMIEQTALGRIFDILPDTLRSTVFPDGPPTGELQAEVGISSPPPGGTFPYAEGKILLSNLNGSLGERKLPFAIGGLDIRLNKTVASVTTQSMNVADIPVSANVAVDQFASPNVSGGINCTIEMARLVNVLKYPGTAETGGQIAIALSGFGALKNWQTMSVNGQVALQNVRWRSADTTVMPLDDVSGMIRFTGREASVERFTLRSGPSTVEIKGRIHELVPYLLHGFKDVAKPRFDFELHSPFIDLDQMFPEDDTSSVPPPLPLVDMIAEGVMQVDSAVYFGVPFGGVTGRITYADWILAISEINGRVYGGTMTGNAQVDFTDFTRPVFELKTESQQIEANEFLSDFTGFGGHLFGRINLSGTFGGAGVEGGDVFRSLTATGDVTMREGRFAGLAFLSTLAGRAQIADIKDSGPIKDMTAHYWIEQGRLYCRDWRFTSEGIMYDIAGSVGFDGSLDYRVQLQLPKQGGGSGLLSQLGDLFGGAGGIALDLALTGTYANPVIALDTKNNRRRFEDNLRDNAKNLLDQTRRRK